MRPTIERLLCAWSLSISDQLARGRATIFSALIAVLFASILTLGCADSFICPYESDDLTFKSFGQFAIGNAGGDDTARRCVANCGWHVFLGNNGGLGSTLQIASPNDDIVFAWAYGNLAGFRVKKGWLGATDRGIRLGDTLAHFESKYPEFIAVSNGHLAGDPEGVHVDAYFDLNGALTELLIGGYISP